jgi:hypothetical protein
VRPSFRILLALVAVFAVWNAWNYVEARRLERAMASLHERASVLGPPAPATGPKYADDAARLYDAAADLAINRAAALLSGKVSSRHLDPLPSEDAAAAREVVAENALAFDLVSRAASMPMRERDSEYRDRSRSRLQLNNLFSMLSFRIRTLARTGEPDAAAAALADQLAALRMFDRLARNLTGTDLGSPPTKASMLSIATYDVELLLNLGRPAAPSLEQLQRTFAIDVSHDFDAVVTWEIHLLSEVAPTVPIMTRYTATGMRIPALTPPLVEILMLPAIRREQARAADVIGETIEASARRVPERLAHLKEIYDAHYNRGVSIVRPWSTIPAIVDLSLRAARSIAVADARARCAVVSIAVERYRMKTGRTPSALSDLVPTYLDAIPLDPFGAEPVRYVARAGAYSVYSVGLNGKDDGGDFQEKRDPETGRMQPPVDVGLRIAIH